MKKPNPDEPIQIKLRVSQDEIFPFQISLLNRRLRSTPGRVIRSVNWFGMVEENQDGKLVSYAVVTMELTHEHIGARTTLTQINGEVVEMHPFVDRMKNIG